jgi:Icc-related predicted phosphoesterase
MLRIDVKVTPTHRDAERERQVAVGNRNLVRLVCLSDTHGYQDSLHVPDGDVLLHAGDLTKRGLPDEIRAVDAWLARLPHRHKLVIAGNHDFLFEREPAQARALLTHATYLEDQAVEIDGIRFYGSPFTPEFFEWAFMLPRGEALRAKWASIPDDVDVLITHGPPHGVLDATVRGEPAGCEALALRVHDIAPRLHLFGHIHEGYGQSDDAATGTHFVNASICTFDYRPKNQPVVYDL